MVDPTPRKILIYGPGYSLGAAAIAIIPAQLRPHLRKHWHQSLIKPGLRSLPSPVTPTACGLCLGYLLCLRCPSQSLETFLPAFRASDLLETNFCLFLHLNMNVSLHLSF